MKQFFTLFLVFLFPLVTFAQAPANDECADAIDLGDSFLCDGTVYSNVNATASNIGMDNQPSCASNPASRDVWFQFTAVDTISDYTVEFSGEGANGLVNPLVTVYRGDCSFDGLQELACFQAELNEISGRIDLLGLTVGIIYYIRISDYSENATPNSGDFTLCVREIDPISTIDMGGSTLCTGSLFDSGGPDGDYSPGENFAYSICPDAPSGCVTFSLDFYNLENGSDFLTFYDGPDTNSPVIGTANSGFGASGDNDGGACFVAQASSGCITVEFTSDGITEFEGFGGSWECSAVPCETPVFPDFAIDVDTAAIANALRTQTTVVTIDTIICEEGSYGVFENGESSIGLNTGLVLSSGLIENNAVGDFGIANDAQENASTGLDNPGDADLDALSDLFGDGDPSFDACVVEVDVYTATDEISFEYVFGSEEYPEFVADPTFPGGGFNDIFALLVSGPGITGEPTLNNQQNIATLPDGTPVQINSVNNYLNYEYYRNNEEGTSLVFDGLTTDFQGQKKSLTASIEVTPCNTYHLKFAVGDRVDDIFDSGVFIAEISGGRPNVNINFNSGIDYLVEDCTDIPDDLIIGLTSPENDSVTYNIAVGGTATIGVDYNLDIPSSITFAPGQTNVAFPITVITDNLTEGTETITISLSRDFGCGETTFETFEVDLVDQIAIEVNAGADTVLVCLDAGVTLEATGAQNYFWTPGDIFDDNSSATPFAMPTEDVTVNVIGTLGLCTASTSVFLDVVDPSVEIAVLEGSTELCEGDQVVLQAVNNVDDAGILWTPAFGLDDSDEPIVTASPFFDVEYTVTVSLGGCEATDVIDVQVDDFQPIEAGLDTTLCQENPVELGQPVFFGSTTYQWVPAESLDDPTSPNPIAQPTEDTNYVVTMTSESGFCVRQDTVSVSVIEADVNFVMDTLELCFPETGEISVSSSNGEPNIMVFPDDALVQTGGNVYTTSSDESIYYFANVEINGCLAQDSILVQVDSLPDLDLFLDPDQEEYCQGDLVTIFSPNFQPFFFAGIEHDWVAAIGDETPLTNLNLVVTLQDTFTYIRETTNNACFSVDSITINVAPSDLISVTPAEAEICAGESVQLEVTGPDGVEEYEWMPDDGSLSATDIVNPVATPQTTTTYMVSAEFAGCTQMAEATVIVLPDPSVTFPAVTTICPGDAITLNLNPQEEWSYTWSSTDPDFDQFDDAAPTVSPASGSVTYTVVVQVAECDPATFEVTINVLEEVVLTVDDDFTACSADNATVTASANVPGTFSWSNGATGPTIGNLPIGVNTLIVSFTDEANCGTTTAEVTVTILESPTADIIDDVVICPGEQVTLNNAPNATFTYAWTSTDPGFTQTSAPAPVVQPGATATYSVVISNGSDCVLEESVTVTVEEEPVVTISGAGTYCLDETVVLTASANTPGEFLWSTGDTGAEVSLDFADAGTETISVTFSTNCFAAVTETAEITLTEPFSVDITSVPDTSSVAQGTAIVLTATADRPLNGAIYTWTEDGEVLDGNGASITVRPDEEGTATYEVTVMEGGCEATASITFEVTPSILQMPNVFVPEDNNDEANRTFGPVVTGEIEVQEFVIYSRWGQVIYESSDGTPWDGLRDGKEAPMDVYVYRVRYIDAQGADQEERGDVTLIR